MSDRTNATGVPELNWYHINNVSLFGNPRKSINPAAIEEMANSILEHGIIQPALARLRDEKPQLWAGQRRYLGLVAAIAKAEAMGLPAKDGERYRSRAEELLLMPLLIQELDDATIKARQIVENLQREDVSPKDEAEGYADLLELKDEEGQKLYTMERLAETVGKNFRYISQRLGLRNAPELLWKAYEEGKVGTRHLELVGRIPAAKKREEAAKMVLSLKYHNRPATVEETIALIQENFRVSLRSVGFKLDDAELLPIEWEGDVRIKGGACTDCPHRSENMKELEGELEDKSGGKRGSKAGVDRLLCCNPACFEEKNNALWRVTKGSAEREGRRVMDVDKTSELFSQYGGDLNYNTPYVDLSEEPGHLETGHYNEEDLPKWDELLKGTDARRTAIMARHPKTKRVHLLLEREKAIELAESNGHKEMFAQRPKPKTPVEVARDSAKDAAEWAKGERERRLQLLEKKYAYQAVGNKLRESVANAESIGPELVEFVVEAATYDGGELLMQYLELDEDSGISDADVVAAVKGKMKDDLKSNPHAWFAWFVLPLLSLDLERESLGESHLFAVMVKHLKLKRADITKAAEAAVDVAMDREAANRELAELEKKGKAEFTPKDILELHRRGATVRRGTMQQAFYKLAFQATGGGTLIQQGVWMDDMAGAHFGAVKTFDGCSDEQLAQLLEYLVEPNGASPGAKQTAAAKKAPAKKAAAKKAPAKNAPKGKAKK